MAASVGVARTARRLCAFLGVFALGLTLASALGVARSFAPGLHGRTLPGLSAWWFRRLARALDMRVVADGTLADAPALMAANHVSWLDVVALGGRVGSSFVAKAEVGRWAFIGWLAAQGGTLFVARTERGSATRVAELMTWRLKRGTRLAFFPEGTTTDGAKVKPFRSRLFTPAVHLGAPVQPVALRYRGPDGGPAPWAAFVGDMSFVPHLWQVLRAPALTVEVRLLAALRPRAGENRRGLAARAEDAVRRAFVEGLVDPPSCNQTVIQPA